MLCMHQCDHNGTCSLLYRDRATPKGGATLYHSSATNGRITVMLQDDMLPALPFTHVPDGDRHVRKASFQALNSARLFRITNKNKGEKLYKSRRVFYVLEEIVEQQSSVVKGG